MANAAPDQNPAFYGHWRGMLQVAKQLSLNARDTDALYIAHHASSILLSRTALEVFLNEIYFPLVRSGQIQPSGKVVSSKTGRLTTLTYKNYISLYVVDRLHIANQSNAQLPIADIELANKIRNYCTHYSADTKHQMLEEAIKNNLTLYSLCHKWSQSPQLFVLNTHVSTWCLMLTCRVIMAIETHRRDPSGVAAENIRFGNALQEYA